MPTATDVIVIGAGQAGLAMSHCLSGLGIEHLVLDRGAIAERWRNERWASLRLLTPNWMTRLPGYRYSGPNPTGFMARDEVTAFLTQYARHSSAPVREYCGVRSVTRTSERFLVETENGCFCARSVVVATGACDLPNVPDWAAGLSPAIRQVTTRDYLHPGDLEPGGVLVIGGSATGVQLAEEIQRSGRPVTVAMGSHVPLPRRYRGRDIMRWMDLSGILSEARDPDAPSERVMRQPSLQLLGARPSRDIGMKSMIAAGIRVVGRVAGADGSLVRLSDGLAGEVARGAARRNRVLDRIDAFIEANGVVARHGTRPSLPDVPGSEAETLDLSAEGIRTVLWATGFRRSYPWLHLPALGADGELIQTGGITPVPGLYALGLPFMRRRNSTFIDGVGADAQDLSRHLAAHLGYRLPRAA